MRQALECEFQTDYQDKLFYRAWLPAGQSVKKAVVLFHRGHEHSGRFQDLVDGLALEDHAFFAWDSRGCGRSPGPRGDAEGLGQLESDMDAFVRHLSQEYGITTEDMVVVAHSVAAVVAGLWVLDYAPRLRGLVLATPALKVKLYVPFAKEGLALLSRFGLMQTVSSYVSGSALTHDPQEARAYNEDSLVSREIATRVLLDLYRGAKRLLRYAANITVPTQVMVARADWVIKNKPIRKLFRRLASERKEIKVYKGFFHAVFHEKGRERVYDDLRNFVNDCFARPAPDRRALLEADTRGPSAERYEWLQAGPPPLSLNNFVWKSTRLSMLTLGRASRGVRLGISAGFSSGEMLDYVYENQARGFTPFGKLVDLYYLNSIGWVCIRQRRKNLVTLLEFALDLLGRSEALKLVDIAGGPGRYLLDLLAARPEQKLEVRVRDRDEQALKRGRDLALERGETRISYHSGDAFCPESLKALDSVDLAVVSGLYELFPKNEAVLRSLKGLAEVVRPEGYLIYTNQPSHPQLELIAETLTHADGNRWVMRCRSSAEIDELVREAGFEKIKTLIDGHGIFSVTLAQRVT